MYVKTHVNSYSATVCAKHFKIIAKYRQLSLFNRYLKTKNNVHDVDLLRTLVTRWLY